ncbi:MAG: TonB-dependent receptor [Pyrinomonadaceae bacterium]
MFRGLSFYLLWALILAGTAGAQSTRELSGTVADRAGAKVAGAVVSIREPVRRTVVTDGEGSFSFGPLPFGVYVVHISASGFGEISRTVRLDAASGPLSITLDIGELNATVTAEVGEETDRQNVPQAVNLIGGREILERANPILAQAAQEETGVNVQRTSPTLGGIFVRGLVGTKVNVFVDGVRYTTSAQRGGISTFFNLNDPSGIESMEILRGSSSAQYGSDALGGTIGIISKSPVLGDKRPELHGEIGGSYNSADRAAGGSILLSYGTNRLGGYIGLAGRRVGEIRTADGLDSHSALTRFLGLRSDILGTRLPDTGFKQYGGKLRLNYSPSAGQQLVFHYSRNQQDDGKRYDQLLGGDGNLIADLKNLMLDLGFIRYVRQRFLGFDEFSVTGSFNSQREERVNQGGQGDPLGTITHQYERTTATGFNFFLNKSLASRHSLTFGGDLYSERVNSPAYTYNPRTSVVRPSRPRIPDKSRYLLGGAYLQDVWQAIPERLRVSGSIRWNGARYRARAADSPVVAGQPLWNDDSLRTGDLSGRIGAVYRLVGGLRIAASYSRGFRAPSITDLGTLGLTGDGFEADFQSAAAFGGTIGTTAGIDAVDTRLPVERQRSEITDNIDLGVRYASRRFETETTVFLIDFRDAITKQTLILPQGSVGRTLGDQTITGQLPSGAVFVPLSTSPVLIRANYTGARIYGFEFETEARITRDLKFAGNYTFIHSEDKETGLPPNIEGGTPPPTGFVSLKYEPAGSWFWLEVFSTLAAKQDRLSNLDLSDRRTGATRSRTQIQNFFRRGACVRGLTNDPDAMCGTGDETILLPTGETILQVQNRVLGPGVNAAPMFTYLPSYALLSVRGGLRFRERSQIFWAFENILDAQHRNPSWGIDGPGRNIRVGYIYRF